MRLQDLALRLLGGTSGEQIIRTAAAASGAITLPAGTTDFSGAGPGVVKQASTGAAFTVAPVAASEVTGTVAVANGGTGVTSLPLTAGPGTWAMTNTLLSTAGTAVDTASSANGTVGNWDGGDLGIVAVTTPGYIGLARVNGTLASPTPLLSGQSLGQFDFCGCAAAGAFSATARGQLLCGTTENWSATAQGTYFAFITTATGGTVTSNKMTINAGVVIGNPTGGDKGLSTLNATTVYANGTALTSDVRLKRDVEPVPAGCLDLVAAIAPKRFRWSPEEGPPPEQVPPGFYERCNWGFVAQDIGAAMAGHDFGGYVEDEGGLASYSPESMIAVLWRALQELSAKVEALEGREPAA